MKLQIFSDLHMDCTPWEPPQTDADVFVIAGDLYDDGARSMRWCASLRRRTGKPVLVVPGNHDFYDSSLPERLREMRAIAKAGDVHLLHNQSIVLGDIRFVGGTLWTDFEADGAGFAPLAKHAAQSLIGDFQYIRTRAGHGDQTVLSPDYAVRMHRRARRALDAALEDAYSEKVVVVTHHAPSLRSLSAGFKGTALNGAFASDMDDYVEQSFAKLWVHGHMHQSEDYCIGSTRILCNPRGGGRYVNAAFEPALVVEV
ncbi:cyclic 3',5'-adenosine monophosphate phosphodiesterase [compost metagenome]